MTSAITVTEEKCGLKWPALISCKYEGLHDRDFLPGSNLSQLMCDTLVKVLSLSNIFLPEGVHKCSFCTSPVAPEDRILKLQLSSQ